MGVVKTISPKPIKKAATEKEMKLVKFIAKLLVQKVNATNEQKSH